MKIKDSYKLRKIAGENLVVEQGRLNADMTKVISLNETAVQLWDALSARDFTQDEVADVLVSTYNISKEQALTDAKKWIDALVKCGIIDA